MKTMYAVIAEEDDYYPAVQTIAVFETLDAAQAYADKQPRCVLPWAGMEGDSDYAVQMRRKKQWFNYTVEPVAVEPADDWAVRGE